MQLYFVLGQIHGDPGPHSLNDIAIESGKGAGVNRRGELKAETEAKLLEFTSLRLQLRKPCVFSLLPLDQLLYYKLFSL